MSSSLLTSKATTAVEILSEKLKNCEVLGTEESTTSLTSKQLPCPPQSPIIVTPALPPQLSSNHRKKKWLSIGIPTVPRESDHLGQTLDSILSQLPTSTSDPIYDNVLIVVMNMFGEGHEFFNQAVGKNAFVLVSFLTIGCFMFLLAFGRL